MVSELAEPVSTALRALGALTAELSAPEPGSFLGELLHRVLLDTLGVVVAGMRTPEMCALVQAWAPEPGAARLLGHAPARAAVEAAAFLHGTAAPCLELDEGNKYARGHPAAHVVPAALALAQRRRARGPVFAAAVLAGHEVASRFGRATRLRPEVHPHGNWGVTGAAAASARLLGLDAERTAGALAAGTGLPLASPWPAARRGMSVRNAWLGATAISGIAAAKLAAADQAPVDDLASTTFGTTLGSFDPAELTLELGTRFDLGNAYLKRHSSCSYTHPAADAALAMLQACPDLRPERIRGVLVETYPAAAALDGTDTGTRLGAMFSVPYVVAAILTIGDAGPGAFDATQRQAPEIHRILDVTRVVATPEFAARLPDERGARVTLTLEEGVRLSHEVPNPVGDVAYYPFGLPEVRAKLAALLPSGIHVDRFESLIRELVVCADVNVVLEEMP